MNKVLKYFWLLAAVAMMFSCQKETGDTPDQQASNEPEEQSPASDPATQDLDPDEYLVGFSAGIENVESKVAVNLGDNSLSFEDGDEVLVVTVNKSGKYVYDSSDGFFKPATTSDAVPVGNARAYYPYSEFSADGTDVTFTMPASVTAGSAEDLGDKVPMAALISSDGVAQFKNLGSILRVRFNSEYTDGETISDVELSVTGANITGSCDVSWSDDTPSISSLDGTTSLRIGTANGHLTSGEYKEFYFFLPASGTLTAMTIKAIYGKTGGYEPYETIRRTSEMILARNQIITIKKPLKGFFSGGDGSADYPYLISSGSDFKAIATLANANAAAESAQQGNGFLTDRTFFGSTAVHYKQTADIDFSNVEIPSIGVYTAIPFQGSYDGDGKKLKNFKITGTKDGSAGLFEYVEGGNLKNIEIVHAQIDATNTAGVLAGRCIGAVKIEGCSLDGGQITGRNSVGFIAHISGNGGIEITDCSVKDFTIITAASGSADANNQGGIVGWSGNGNSSILRCSTSGTILFTGTVSGTGRGGIIGKFDSTGEITECTNSAFVNNIMDVNYTGGIAGILSKGTITDCISIGDVTGFGYVGGIVGGMLANSSSCVFVDKCRVNATITGKGTDNKSNCTGGIVGSMQNGVLSTCFAKGSVTCSSYDVGGIAGQVYANGSSAVYNRPYVYDCIAANDVTSTRASGSGNVGGVIGRIVRNASYTAQYAAVDNCLGLNQNITSSLQYTGAFVGYVNAGSDTNAGNVRVRNCISLIEDSNFNVTTSNANTGGFVGNYLGQLTHCYYLVSNNNQTATSGAPAALNLTRSDLATLTSASFCTDHSSRAAGYLLNVNGVQYKSSGWTYYSTGLYPVPTTLYNLGEEYYK